MTFNPPTGPHTGGGRHRSGSVPAGPPGVPRSGSWSVPPGSGAVPVPPQAPPPPPSTTAYSAYNPSPFPGAYSGRVPLPEPEDEQPDDGFTEVERPRRHPWVLASVVGLTVFVVTATVAGTLWAVNDSRARRSENYAADNKTTVSVTVTETDTTTTTVTAKPSRSASPDSSTESESGDDSDASAASSGWYAQFGSFTSLDSANELASKTGAEVYRGEAFGQPGQYVVAQRESSKSGAHDACDIADQACIVKHVD